MLPSKIALQRGHFFSTCLVLWLLISLTYSYIHQWRFDNAMALSRLDLLYSLTHNKSFAIDDYHTNTPDKAFIKGHYYSDKAPGTILLALPSFYAASRILFYSEVSVGSKTGWLFSSWFTVSSSIGVFTALGMLCLFLWLLMFIPPRCALVATFVAAFGTLAFPYATTLLSHSVVIASFGISLWLLRFGSNEPMGKDRAIETGIQVRDALAGLFCGFAIACEFDAALVAGGILVGLLVRNVRRGGLMMFGAVPPLLLIPVYNWITSGNPLSLPYSHEAVFTEMHKGFFGIHAMNGFNLWLMLFSIKQGLFVWSPFLVLCPIGYRSLFKSHHGLFWVCYAVPLIHVFVISGYFLVDGWTIGSRFLAPIIPLLILPAGIGLAKLPRIGGFLALMSLAVTGAATLVSADLPGNADNALLTFYLPELLKGHYARNFGELLGLKSHWAMLPLFVVALCGTCYLWRRVGYSQSLLHR